ncbi:4-hydroxy-3-methylbut-2-enyl diphosphate reductase [Geofilum rubicundum]|uniref:4-hydroxy-3-methylbut-2-enyl diphosphate reductase n=1 Tax=Geofilum rubicundum JCM 15548 TaxID=1236989 RepID=A0A0E9LUM8_9BACT|nr:4-hydroxy-3-methylbut-2-enyl diphosphate reductase [Geofilum rubicundum]GAO28993.1 4-hydroxy-3-methylbut-2-enyl diphosphate reductase [Geofilum rubicundum JCM 15548]
MNAERKPTTTIVIDAKSGFCFGVSKAIKTAEAHLQKGGELTSLGDIVHNEEEIKRLREKGLHSVGLSDLSTSNSPKVLFRAHGEPPSSYETIKAAGKEIIDATCPVVLKLQQRIFKAWQEIKMVKGQIVIYGKKNHAEVIGLSGQTNNEAIVVQSSADLHLVDASKKTILFAQTTMSQSGLEEMEGWLRAHLHNPQDLTVHKTICAQVGNRVPHLKEFAKQYQVIIFVGGRKSSNGKVLYEVCRSVNPHSHFVSGIEEIQPSWLNPAPASIGICGATSTPQWLMEHVAEKVHSLLSQDLP